MSFTLRRKMTAVDGPGWAVTDYDGSLKPGRWATEEEATEEGLLGVYLLSGHDVVEVREPEAPEPTKGLGYPNDWDDQCPNCDKRFPVLYGPHPTWVACEAPQTQEG